MRSIPEPYSPSVAAERERHRHAVRTGRRRHRIERRGRDRRAVSIANSTRFGVLDVAVAVGRAVLEHVGAVVGDPHGVAVAPSTRRRRPGTR